MDKEHIKGAADKAKGAVKDAFGKMTDDKRCRSKARWTRPKARRATPLGDAKDAAPKGQRNLKPDPRRSRKRPPPGGLFSFTRRGTRNATGQNMPVAGQPPPDKDEKTNQAQAQSDTEPFDPESGSLPELRKAADDLKTKIDEAKRRNDMPLDSALGNPGWEQRAADGRLDVPDRGRRIAFKSA